MICEESGWQYPAHNNYVKSGPRLPLPDTSAPIIDLFAAETGAQLALTATLLADDLDAVSPEIMRRIDRELTTRIIEPYLNNHFWWMGGEDRLNNWTAWCTQNVLLTAFTRPTDQRVRRAVIEQAASSLDQFLATYGDDGACEEGALYYRHAGLALANALDVLGDVAPDAFAELWHQPKLRNIAEYIVNAHIDDTKYFNFADCSAVLDRCSAGEFLFGIAVGSNDLAAFAAADWRRSDIRDLPENWSLFERHQAAFAAAAMQEHIGEPPTKADIYYPSVGLMIARDDRFALAAKAGHNGESHNHNDVGSVTLYKDGRPLLIDVGVETYRAKTFSDRRYEIWTMQSAYHNVATFGGVMQQAGEPFAATGIEAQLTPPTAIMEMELAGAYPAEATVRSYRRRVQFTKNQSIEITDTFDADRQPELSLMFAELPVIDGKSIAVPGLAAIAITGGGQLRRDVIPIADERLLKAWPGQLWRVLIPVVGNRLTLTIR